MRTLPRLHPLFIACLLLATLTGSVFSNAWPEKPNIVLILADDYGWSDASFMGSKYYETPNLDKMAKHGMKFTSAYSNAPNCAPTRACLMTGLYSPRHGIYTVGSSERGDSKHRKLISIENKTTLDTNFTTLPEVLRKAGYHTASIGKWHLGRGKQGGPGAHGFDLNIGGDHEGKTRSHFSPYNNPTLPDGPEGEYLTDRLTQEAVRYIEDHREGPFFLYLPHYAVHTPIQAKEEMVEKYENKSSDGDQNHPTYAAMVESLDESVGGILDTLDRLNIRDNTLVLFFSDNGGHGGYTSNSPLRGMKGMLYEGGIRVPMVASLPGTIPQDAVTDTPVIGLDFLPTLMEVAGIAKPTDLELDGESFAPVLLGNQPSEDRALFWHFPAYLQMHEGGEGIWRTTPVGVIRKGDWKLLEFFEDERIELYNLAEDLAEAEDRSKDYPDRVEGLLSEMKRWRLEVNAPIPSRINPEYRPN